MGDEHSLPKGEQFEPYHETITNCVEEVMAVPYEEVEILSQDGLRLAGKYYHLTDGAPLILFFHGYRSNMVRDGNGMFLYTRKLGYNVLLVDQRAHGKSEGKTITFGIKERYDCQSWANYAAQRFGKEQKIYLCGLSMGGATVLMASDLELPENVIGIIADCPYSSPKGIICSVMKKMRFPIHPTYWFAKQSARFIGKFNVEEASAMEAIQRSKLPILILHGDADNYVPCSMSVECQAAASDHVQLVLIKGAGHGMGHCADTPGYEKEVYAFFQKTQGLVGV